MSMAAVAALSPPPPPPPPQKIKHDIFLSHSGKQKGFAKDLAARLSFLGYTVFFDQNYDSLPPGEDFPSHIFSAARTCKLALVLISEDFVTSRWPLMELCSFVDRLPSQSLHASAAPSNFTILPLFFKLSPADLKAQENVKKWRKEWKKIELERKNGRISAAKSESAVTKVLPRFNGVDRRPESEQGESSYIDEIIKHIGRILLPRNVTLYRYGADLDKQYVGVDRLSQIILEEFGKLEDLRSTSESDGNFTDGCILGMYGVSGSGKSTLCNFLCNSMLDEFMGKVIHLELPTKLRGDDDPCIREQYAKLLSISSPYTKETFSSMDLVQLYNLVLQMGAQFSHKMFLVLDNISKCNYESYKSMLKAILRSAVLRPGSRVMLVAQSCVILENLLKEVKQTYRYAIKMVPSLTREEAMEVIRHNCYPLVKEDVISHLLDKSSFPSSSFMYVPFLFEQIGILLRNKCGSECLKELQMLSKMVDEGRTNAIQKLVEVNFKMLREDLQVLLFDIALFIVPRGYGKLSDATPILCRMHDMTDTDAIKLECKIKDLMEHCAVSIIDGELRVHDMYMEYARSIPANSKSYVDVPSLDISDALVFNGQNHSARIRTVLLRMEYSEARTIYIGSVKGLAHPPYEEDVQVGTSAEAVEVRLDVKVGTTTRALFVRNSSRYYKCILGLFGNFSSLVCFRLENVRLVAFSPPSGCDVDLSRLVRFELKNENITRATRMRAWGGQKRKRVSMFLDFIGTQIQNTTQSMKWLLKPLLAYDQWAASDDQSVSNFLLSRRMSQLRVLILVNASIRRLENIGGYCPQLEVLEVLDDEQYVMDVTVSDVPKLKRLVAGEHGWICGRYVDLPWHYCATSGIYYQRFRKLRPKNSRRLTLRICECPELETLYVDGSFDQVQVVGLLPSSLRKVALESDRCLQTMPTELVSSSLHQLSLLETLKLACKKVETLSLTRLRLGCLPCLKEMSLSHCDSLTHVSMEPGFMPSLVSLKVSLCEKLQVIEGLQDILWMEQLKVFRLSCLPQLRVVCDVGLGSRLQLEEIEVYDDECPTAVKMITMMIMMMAMHPSQRMEWISLDGVGNCKWQSEDEDEDAEKRANAGENKALLHTSSRKIPLDGRLTFPEGRFTHLWSLKLWHVNHLREIRGIQHLPNLSYLWLWDLPHVARVSGTWPTSIGSLCFRNCSTLLEIPPLQHTPELWSLWCDKCTRLKRVEGRFGEMKRLMYVTFEGCESMEAFPMEDVIAELGKRRTEQPECFWSWGDRLSVEGTKFASVELMQRWLEDAEWGSPLWEAAVEVLILRGALDALCDYLFALVLDNIKEVYFHNLRYLFFPSHPNISPFFIKDEQHKEVWAYQKKPELKLLEERLFRQYPQLSNNHTSPYV